MLCAGLVLLGAGRSQRRLNPIVELLSERKPVFGVTFPERPTSAQVAVDAIGYTRADYIFDGTMEVDFDTSFSAFRASMKEMAKVGTFQKTPSVRLHHPLVVKTPKIATNPALARERIAKQLNIGVSGITFVGVEGAEELRTGLAAMRFRSHGGTRPNTIDSAASYWGLSEREYHDKADLWPLNPNGELVSFVVVESKKGLANLREIAAVKGIGALFAGAGTLRELYTTKDSSGKEVFDEKAWESAIQQVLGACKEFKVPCGLPVNETNIEARMKQGFTVFVIGASEGGFRAVEVGRRIGAR
jgi:4-hydroxy-2-oxoheptanedioate aldolase